MNMIIGTDTPTPRGYLSILYTIPVKNVKGLEQAFLKRWALMQDSRQIFFYSLAGGTRS
ncbi:MAG: hypothetical protein HFG27_11530 [Provencibacterium sp.]|nr:hypothetical protein [Provencibacterium sp.]